MLDIDPANTNATIVADLGEADCLPAARFDCVIFTQTLHLIPDMRVALANIWRALAPGGVLLLTVPALGRHDTRRGFITTAGASPKQGWTGSCRTFQAPAPLSAPTAILVSCTAFLYGLAAEELSSEELHVHRSAVSV